MLNDNIENFKSIYINKKKYKYLNVKLIQNNYLNFVKVFDVLHKMRIVNKTYKNSYNIVIKFINFNKNILLKFNFK